MAEWKSHDDSMLQAEDMFRDPDAAMPEHTLEGLVIGGHQRVEQEHEQLNGRNVVAVSCRQRPFSGRLTQPRLRRIKRDQLRAGQIKLAQASAKMADWGSEWKVFNNPIRRDCVLQTGDIFRDIRMALKDWSWSATCRRAALCST